jgi:hypothetical protein
MGASRYRRPLRRAACRWRWPAAATLALALACSAAAVQAQPANGLGAFAGYAYHWFNKDLTSAGLSLAGDAQFAINDRWSLNPILQLSQEQASGAISGTVRNAGIALQLRGWMGAFYAGVHAGLYYRYFEGGFAPASRSTSGGGVAAGWEGSGGWILGAQVDAPEPRVSPVAYGVRLHVGYRWH